MTRFEEGKQLINLSCGHDKDNVIALSTIALEKKWDKVPCSHVRDVDAYYEDGVFYVTTWSRSRKIQEIEKNKHVAFSVSGEGISGTGIGENLGWIMKPDNAVIREKLRKSFEAWYDQANNEADETCVILAIHMDKVKIFRDHGAIQYELDFVNRVVL